MILTAAFRQSLRHPSAIIVGCLVGLALVVWWPSIIEVADRATDAAFPVVRSQAELISHNDGAAIIRVKMSKQRDCEYKGVQAYSRQPGDVLRDAMYERVDWPLTGRTRPVGYYDIGHWKIWPTSGAAGVVLFAQHDCGGRLVSSLLADVRI
jgi:hypothetical protein